MSDKTGLSIIIPVYNSAEIFPILYKRLIKTLEKSKKSFEIITVADGCRDNSAKIIEEHCKSDKRLKLIEFSRNFGHQSAVTAGLEHARGNMVIIMDDDLEDPPEIIPSFIEKAEQGFDVVYGIRKKRKVSIFHRVSYFIFYRLLNKIADIDLPYDVGDFCLMKRPILDKLNAMPESNRYIRGLRSWLGFEQTGIEYERDMRYAGEPGYNMTKYIKFGIDGITSFSYKPLQYVSIIGFIIASLSFILGIYLIIAKLFNTVKEVPGWASLMIIVLFIGGIQLLSVGILGQYIARIYDEVKQRPNYIIKRYVGFENKKGYERKKSGKKIRKQI